MNLKDKYFHGVIGYDEEGCIIPYFEMEEKTKDIIKKFEMILSSGYILPLNEIIKLYGDVISRNQSCRFNGDDLVSVSRYKDNETIIDRGYMNENSRHFEDGFKEFVTQGLAIVLNEKIWSELKHPEYSGIYLERFISEPISLKYMDAVAVDPKLFYLSDFFYYGSTIDYSKYDDINKRLIGKDFIDNVKSQLNRFGYDVPVLNIHTGSKIHNNPEYRRFLSRK